MEKLDGDVCCANQTNPNSTSQIEEENTSNNNEKVEKEKNETKNHENPSKVKEIKSIHLLNQVGKETKPLKKRKHGSLPSKQNENLQTKTTLKDGSNKKIKLEIELTEKEEKLLEKKNDFVSWLKQTIQNEQKHEWANTIEHTSLSFWISQFKTRVIPAWKLYVLKPAIIFVLQKFRIDMKDLGQNETERNKNFCALINWIEEFCKIIDTI